MTAQIGDIYKYQDKGYSVVALSTGESFRPQMHGMEPHPSSTGCCRGYWCEYAIIEKQLVLKDLYLFNKDDSYPPLNGIKISPQEFEEYERWNGNSKKREKVNCPAHFGHRV